MVERMKIEIEKNRGQSIRRGSAWSGSHPAKSLIAVFSNSDEPLDVYIVNEKGMPISPKKEIAIVMSGENRNEPYLCGARILIDDRDAYAIVVTEKDNPKNVLKVKEGIWY